MAEIPKYQSQYRGKAKQVRVISRPTGFRVPIRTGTAEEESLGNMVNAVGGVVNTVLNEQYKEEADRKALEAVTDIQRMVVEGSQKILESPIEEREARGSDKGGTGQEKTKVTSWTESIGMLTDELTREVEAAIEELPPSERKHAQEYFTKQQVGMAGNLMAEAKKRDNDKWVATQISAVDIYSRAGASEELTATLETLADSGLVDPLKLGKIKEEAFKVIQTSKAREIVEEKTDEGLLDFLSINSTENQEKIAELVNGEAEASTTVEDSELFLEADDRILKVLGVNVGESNELLSPPEIKKRYENARQIAKYLSDNNITIDSWVAQKDLDPNILLLKLELKNE
jgi:hypothetical protein